MFKLKLGSWLALAVCLAGCGRGPERWLVGQWQMDMAATRAGIEAAIERETEEDSVERALRQAFLAGVAMQQREMTFYRDGTVRAVVRGDPEQIPWPGGGAVLQEEEGEWQAVEAADGMLGLRVVGGDRQFADWRVELRFVDRDRFYYYTGEEMNVREYWTRK